MLNELRIDNFAIIDHLHLEFGTGLIIFTGETGAGKSILIDAIESLLGGKVDVSIIRTGADFSYIEGIFKITSPIREIVSRLLAAEDLDEDLDYFSLSREIRRNGRNIARVNGRNVNLSYLKELGQQLVDIHGQSEHLSLLKPSNHLQLLDEYIGDPNLLSSYKTIYQEYLDVQHELAQLLTAERESARRIDLLSYQLNEIESAHLIPGEEENLLTELNRLSNAENIASIIEETRIALDEETPDTVTIVDLLGRVISGLHNLARLDKTQAHLVDQAQMLFDEATDLSQKLRTYSEEIEHNPKKLEQVENRLNLIHHLKKKYGDTIQSILSFAQDAHRQLETITHASERIKELENMRDELLNHLKDKGLEISHQRQIHAEILSKSIEKELADLKMSKTQFKVEFIHRIDPRGFILDNGQSVGFDIHGLEHAEFLIAPNPGEGLKPLAKIASGGETSRLMLALKHVLVSADHIPSLIFDEIDQGIGGRVGSIVGEKLWKLGRLHQVFCVTHLPQLAAYGDEHFNVRKEMHAERTVTVVEKLSPDKRQTELAQMLGGISEGTMQSARELLDNVKAKVSH